MNKFLSVLLVLLLHCSVVFSQENPVLSFLDVFELEYASDPQISPNGNFVVYKRMGFDILNDKAIGSLWLLNITENSHRKLTSRKVSESSPRWSPSGDRIVFVSATSTGLEIFMYWMQTGKAAKISQLKSSPSSLTWAPNGKTIAFASKILEPAPVLVKMPNKPKGAKWAKPARITDRLKHEADGLGYILPGYHHIFTILADGGSVRQITSGNFHHKGALSWSPKGNEIYFSANRNTNWEYDFVNSEVYKVEVSSKKITALTNRKGPDYNPIISPNGKHIAYLGYFDKVQTYQLKQLQLMNVDGTNKKTLSNKLDRSISSAKWSANSQGLYISYDDHGKTKVSYINLNGNITEITNNLGGTSLGRPYPGGSFSVSKNGTIAFTYSQPNRPADVALVSLKNKKPKVLTLLNEDILSFRNLGKVKEVNYTSSIDGRKIQGWIVTPPNYNQNKKYPLIVENHGGPILNYGDRFSIEIQLYAAAGYIVFYPNPRGSTSYGEVFGNLLYHNYPGEDYNDVMDGVDYLINRGIIDKTQLFVTGGSAGGIMTAWIIGKNNRFKAAVVTKPVINWISKTLVADNYYAYANYRYPGQPWENFETYWKFSPISLVGNISTPTMLIVGMNDLRTPPSEAKQLYHALKLRKIETVLVEIPEASHAISKRPSNLITKVAHTLVWFEKFRD